MKVKYIPNILTVLRAVGAVGVIAIMFLADLETTPALLYAGGLFLLCALTDMLDGNIARKHDVVSVFGQFVDPIADKFLIVGVLIAFLVVDHTDHRIMATCIIIIIARDFIITSIRLMSAERGIVVDANIWGKAKTVVQVIAICINFFAVWARWSIFGKAAIIISTAVTVISGIIYLKDFVKTFDKKQDK